jgi:hypothetical protein
MRDVEMADCDPDNIYLWDEENVMEEVDVRTLCAHCCTCWLREVRVCQ